MPQPLIVLLGALLLAAASPGTAAAQAGALDPSFGGTGRVLTDFGSNLDWAVAVAIDGQGRIVTVGNTDIGDLRRAIVLSRHHPDGSLDASFGDGGRVLTEVGFSAHAAAGAIDAQGRLVVVGASQAESNASEATFLLLRYDDDGTLDELFGSGGHVLTDLPGFGGGANGLAFDSRGRILVAGIYHDGVGPRWIVARYDGFDGSLDPTFGAGGIVDTRFGTDDSPAAHAIAVDDQERIVVAGEVFLRPASQTHFAVARYNGDGSLDSSFGDGGRVLTRFSVDPADHARALVLDAQGRIVVAGWAWVGGSAYFAAARYRPDGSLDPDFGAGSGRVLTAFGGNALNFAHGLAIDAQGRIMLAGESSPSAVDYRDLALVRYDEDGTLDTSFGSGGKVLTDFGGTDEFVTGSDVLVLDSQGRIVVAAALGPDGGYDVLLVRYQAESLADLGLTKTASPASAAPGEAITYTLTVTNSGPSDAHDVVVSDDLPAAVTFVSCSATAGICGGSGNSRTVTFSSLPSGASATVVLQATLEATVMDGSTVTNTATVSAATADPDLGDNTAAAAVLVQNRADLRVSQTVAKLSNRQLRYTITVQNLGPYRAAQVLLNDSLPASTRLVSVASGAWACDAPPPGATGTVSCALPGLAADAVETLTLVVKTTAPGSVDITNTATVGAATFDPNLANNSATLVTRVAGQ